MKRSTLFRSEHVSHWKDIRTMISQKRLMFTFLVSLVSSVMMIGGGMAAEMQVTEKGGLFQPNAITIKAGDTVKFNFGNASMCQLLVADADYSSMAPPPSMFGQEAARTFPRAGIFHAKCAGQDKWSLIIMVRPQV